MSVSALPRDLDTRANSRRSVGPSSFQALSRPGEFEAKCWAVFFPSAKSAIEALKFRSVVPKQRAPAENGDFDGRSRHRHSVSARLGKGQRALRILRANLTADVGHGNTINSLAWSKPAHGHHRPASQRDFSERQ